VKFVIHHDSESGGRDEVVVEGKDLDDIRVQVGLIMGRRGWHKNNCWSEQIKD
jgi:hypothetical protein